MMAAVKEGIKMKTPLIPFNFAVFPKCKHLIAFLEDTDFDSVEYLEYENSTNGSAREVVLTFKNTEQLVLINSSTLVDKLNEAGRKAIYADISFNREKLRTGALLVKFEFESDEYSGKVVCQSLFPPSDYHSGVVDPSGHAKKGIPFMFSRQNTFAVKCGVMINGEIKKLRVAKSAELAQFNSFEVYYSDEFTLVSLSLKKQMLDRIKQDEDECIYQDSSIWHLKQVCANEIIRYKENNPAGEVYHYLLNEEGKIEELQLGIKDETALRTVFEPAIPIDDLTEKINGKMMIHIHDVEHIFECTYSIIGEYGENKSELSAAYTCCYNNDAWIEEKRGITCNTSMLYNDKKECVKFTVKG